MPFLPRFQPPPKIPGYKPDRLLVLILIGAIVGTVHATIVWGVVPFLMALVVLLLVGIWKAREKTPWRRRGRN